MHHHKHRLLSRIEGGIVVGQCFETRIDAMLKIAAIPCASYPYIQGLVLI
jgi:hypothetical protein